MDNNALTVGFPGAHARYDTILHNKSGTGGTVQETSAVGYDILFQQFHLIRGRIDVYCLESYLIPIGS